MMSALRDTAAALERAMPGFATAIGAEDPDDGHAEIQVSGRAYTQRTEQLGEGEQWEGSPAVLLTAGRNGQIPYVVGDSPWLS